MKQSIDEQWRAAFLQTVQQHDRAQPLKEAALEGRLGAWTKELTAVVVSTCQSLGWQASAKGHRLELLPVTGSEYLGIDVMAFAQGETRWRFPAAVIELENSQSDDRVAYSLWKVLCLRADLRIVFCYRRTVAKGSALMRSLREEAIEAIGVAGRMKLEGETLVVIGSYDSSSTFPYGFFKWLRLDNNTGTFTQA
ncbi:MAG: hypothetical protein H0V18_00590 [Pyrinomonadaceae bacterium]|nr:hypothetical protein [Pyrinomonadaceae bacterium]